jgi:hypothetical protein
MASLELVNLPKNQTAICFHVTASGWEWIYLERARIFLRLRLSLRIRFLRH